MTLRIFWRIAIRLASHSARRHDSDENHRGWYGVVVRVKDSTGRSLIRSRFRSSLHPSAAAGEFCL